MPNPWDFDPVDTPEAGASGFSFNIPGIDFLDDLLGGGLSKTVTRRQTAPWDFDPIDDPAPRFKLDQDYLEQKERDIRTRERKRTLLDEDVAGGRGGYEPLNLQTEAGLGAIAGGLQLGRAAAGVARAIPGGDALGAKGLADYFNQELGEISELGRSPARTGKGEFVNILAQGATSVLPTILASPLGWTGVLATAGLQSAGGPYADAVDAYEQQGLPTDQAKLKAYLPAILSGVLTAGITRLFGSTGAEAFVRDNAVKAAGEGLGTKLGQKVFGKEFSDYVKSQVQTPLSRIGAGISDEAVEEALDQVGQGVVQALTYDPDKDLFDIVNESIQAGVIGGILGGGVTGAKEGVSAISRARRRKGAQPATESTQVIETEPAIPGAQRTEPTPSPEVDAFNRFRDAQFEAETGVGRVGAPGLIPEQPESFTMPEIAPETTISRAKRGDARKRVATRIIEAFGVSPDLAEEAAGQFLAQNPKSVGEQLRTDLVEFIQQVGLENERSNLYKENPADYELAGHSPEQAQALAEQAKVANQQLVGQVQARNRERLRVPSDEEALDQVIEQERQRLQREPTVAKTATVQEPVAEPALPSTPVRAQILQPQVAAEEPSVLTKRGELDALFQELKGKKYPKSRFKSLHDDIRRVKNEIAEEEIAKVPKGASVVRLRSEKWLGGQFPLEVLITPSTDPKYKGKWQATKIDDKGPMGHEVFDSIEDAIRSWTGLHVKGSPPTGDQTFTVVETRTKKGGELKPDEKRKLQKEGDEGQRLLTPPTPDIAGVADVAPASQKKTKVRATKDMVDFLDYLDMNGIKIKSRAQAGEGSKGYYGDAYDWLSKKTSMRKYFATKPGEGQSLDEVLDMARREGAPGISEESTTDDVWDLLEQGHVTRSKAPEMRKKERERLGEMERQLIEFQKVAIDNKGRGAVEARKAEQILVDNLQVGDEFTLKGERVKVTDVVLDEDPESGTFVVRSVELSDGTRFGQQTVEGGTVVHVDGKSLKEKPVAFAPEEESSTPQLRPMENQGDLLSGQQEDFALAGETGTDFERIQQAQQAQAQARADQEQKQQQLPQGSISSDLGVEIESEPFGFGRGREGMKRLIEAAGPKLPAAVKLVLNAWINTPVMQDLDWDFMQLQIWSGRTLEDGMAGVRVGDLIRIAMEADPQTLPHEFAHVLFDFLPENYKGYVESKRREAVLAKYGQGAPQVLLDGNMTTEEFMNSDDLSLEDYPLINASEFLSKFVGQKFADETFANRNVEQSIWLKIRNWFVAMVDGIRRTFGIGPTFDQIYREMLAGRWQPTREGVEAMRDAQASFSYNAAEAANAARLVRDPEERIEQADDQQAQAQNLFQTLVKAGQAIQASLAAQKALGFFDYSGIAKAGADLNGGKVETYQQIKAKLRERLDPREFEYRIKALARLAAQQVTRFENRMRQAIKEGNEALAKLSSPRTQYLIGKVSQSQMDKLNAEVVEKTNKSVFETALKQSYKQLEEEAENDLRVAELEARINELGAAAQSSTAMQLLMQDIISLFSSDPQGQAFLDGESFEPTPVPGQPARTSDPIELYRQIKRERDEPFNETLLKWAFFILKRNQKLRDQLYATHLYSTVPGIEAQMNSFQSRFALDMKTDPVKTIRGMMRERERSVAKREKAKFVYLTLNKQLEELLEEIGPKIEAGEIAQAALNDFGFQAHAVEVRRDGQYIGTQKPLLEYSDKMVLLPSGRQLDVNPERIVGAKDLWDQTRNDIEAGIRELKDWLSDPQNLDNPNYGTHQKDLNALEEYYHGQAMNRPNDPIGIWTYSLYIVNNAIRAAGGRVSGSVKRAAAAWDRIRMATGFWNQKWSKEITLARIAALKSHGYTWTELGSQSLTDSNNLWYDTIGRELAASYAKGSRGYRAGDRLSSGVTVTKEDLADLKTQADATSEGFKIVESEQFTEDQLGDATAYRKASKSSDYMTTREFNQELRETVGRAVTEARKTWLAARKSGDENLLVEATENLKSVFNQYWALIGRAMVTDRDPDFARATIYDGEGGPLQEIASVVRQNPNYLRSIDELFDELAKITETEPDDTADTILDEFSRIIQTWYNEAKSDNEGTMGLERAKETKNHFSRARTKVLAPFIFYEYGFKNTSRSIASFGNAVHQRAMDRLVSGLKALVEDIDRQEREFQSKVENLRRQGVQGAEKRVINQNAIARKNGETFDNYQKLERRRKLVTDIISSLTSNENFDAEGNITLGRTMGAMTGWLVSGIITTARNLTSGPRYLGWVAHKFVGSSLKSYPMAAWYTWVDQMLFRSLPSMGLSFIKTPAYLTIDFFKALKILESPERSLGMFASKWFYRALTELGETMHLRIAEVAKLHESGVLFVDSAAKDFETRMMGSAITQGRIFHRNFGTTEKLFQLVPTMMELLITFPRTFAPAFGDVALNAATSKTIQWAIGKLEERLAAMMNQPGFENRFDYTNIGNPNNLISAKEFSNGRAAEQDLFRLRQEFEGAGLSFDEEAVKFFAERQTDPQAQFLSPEGRLNLINYAINAVNRSAPTGAALNLKERTFLTSIIAPLMHWKTRMFSQFLNQLAVPATTAGKVESNADLLKHRAMQWAILMTTVLLPMLILGGIGVSTWEEEQARLMKQALYDQINATRQPWEREGLKSQVVGYGLSATFGIPFLDMLVNAAINDMPNRASVDPSLAMVEKTKDTVKYISGVMQTGDLSYRLPELVGGLIPDTKIFLNRMDTEEGKREGANAVAVIRRKGPTDLLRAMGMGSDVGVNANELSPMGPRLENAILRGDLAEFQGLVEETKLMAQNMGIADPDKRVKQLVLSRSPYSRALKAKLTEAQLEQFKARLSPDERALVEDVEMKFSQAAALIDARFTVAKAEPQTSPTIGGGPSFISRAGRSRIGSRRIGRRGTGRTSRSRRRSRLSLSRRRRRVRR